MPVRVKVKNFQSIQEAEVYIDGLTAITGPNNSGKTALLRAVRGVFTNPSAKALVRHGAAYLSVELEFDDGTTILWEKGWEKPNQKGAGVNRYKVNGVEITTVGRGVPPEVEALGVREIRAGTARVWPQIARQFLGTLFLVDKPGSALAEALSDVEKVGKLTRALKLSEKDRRAKSDELKVRRKDVKDAEREVESFSGLGEVADKVALLEEARERVLQKVGELKEVRVLKEKLETSRGEVERLRGFDVTIPDPGVADSLRQLLKEVRALDKRRKTALDEVENLKGAEVPEFPDSTRAEKLSRAVEKIRTLRKRYTEAREELEGFDGRIQKAEEAVKQAFEEVTQLLGDRGVCPTCNTVHEAGAPHA